MTDGMLIGDLWMMMSNFMKEADREHVAKELVQMVSAYGFTVEDFEDMVLENDDPTLRKAIEQYADFNDYEDFEEEYE